MSNQLTVIDGYAEREATNDNNAENLNISYICGNVVDFFVNFRVGSLAAAACHGLKLPL